MRRMLIVQAVLLATSLLIVPPAESAQPTEFKQPDPPENLEQIGSKIQRTMTLLATSTPQHRNQVKIFFYGQSVTAGSAAELGKPTSEQASTANANDCFERMSGIMRVISISRSYVDLRLHSITTFSGAACGPLPWHRRPRRVSATGRKRPR